MGEVRFFFLFFIFWDEMVGRGRRSGEGEGGKSIYIYLFNLVLIPLIRSGAVVR